MATKMDEVTDYQAFSANSPLPKSSVAAETNGIKQEEEYIKLWLNNNWFPMRVTSRMANIQLGPKH